MPKISFKEAAILAYLSRNPTISQEGRARMTSGLSPTAATFARNMKKATQGARPASARRRISESVS